MHRLLFTLLLGISLTACGTTPGQIPMQEFHCQDGTILSIHFHDQQATVVTPDGTVITLPQQPSASGFWYSTGRHELRGKGNEITWTIGRRVPVTCQLRDG